MIFRDRPVLRPISWIDMWSRKCQRRITLIDAMSIMGQFSMEISWYRVSPRWHRQAQAFLKTGYNPEVVQQLIDKGYLVETPAPTKKLGLRIHRRKWKREMRNSRKYRFEFETRTETLRLRPAIVGLGYGLDSYRRDEV